VKRYDLEINGKRYLVEVEAEPGHRFRVLVNDQEFIVELKSVQRERPLSSQTFTPLVVRHQVSQESEVAGEMIIRAPIPGVVKKVLVKEGDEVGEGDILAVIEAMKMENNIISSTSGIVKEVKVREGEPVKLHQVLIILKVKEE